LFSSSLGGKHHLPIISCHPHTTQHQCPHAGEPRAAPSGAGHCGCANRSLEPLDVCAFAPATRRAHVRAK
jgi:hypothetical protein